MCCVGVMIIYSSKSVFRVFVYYYYHHHHHYHHRHNHQSVCCFGSEVPRFTKSVFKFVMRLSFVSWKIRHFFESSNRGGVGFGITKLQRRCKILSSYFPWCFCN